MPLSLSRLKPDCFKCQSINCSSWLISTSYQQVLIWFLFQHEMETWMMGRGRRPRYSQKLGIFFLSFTTWFSTKTVFLKMSFGALMGMMAAIPGFARSINWLASCQWMCLFSCSQSAPPCNAIKNDVNTVLRLVKNNSREHREAALPMER